MGNLVSCVTLAMLLLFWVPAQPVRAADQSTDIPGVPLVGSVVSSSVGGAVTDRVWELNLEAGRVLIIRLEGSTGSELGLYLFHGDARTVVSDVPLKSSALPGGRQYLSASLSPGRYFINVNGRNTDRLYNFTMYVTTLEDQTPPSLAPVVVGGSNRVSSTRVEIDAQAVDQLSGVNGVRARVLVGGAAEWGSWVESTQKISVNLPSAEGTYQVELQARNGLGLVSQPARIALVLDLTRPRAAPIGELQRGVVTKTFANLAILLSEPIDAATIRDGVYVTDSAGRKVEGVASFNTDDSLLTFRASTPLILGRTYIVDLVGVRDRAGNPLAQPTAHSFTYLRATSLRMLSPLEISVRYGREIQLDLQGSLIPEAAILYLERRAVGNPAGEWVTMQELRASKDGQVSATVTAIQSGELRVRFPGDTLSAPSVSRVVKLQVAARGSLALIGAPSQPKAGTTLQFVAQGRPMTLVWSLRIRRCNSQYSACQLIQVRPVELDAQGRTTIPWESSRGYWDFRLVATGSGDVDGFKSSRIRIRVQ